MTDQTVLEQWLVLWQARPLSSHCVSALAGLVGSGVYAAIASPQVMLWRWDRKARVLHLGFLSSAIIGVTAAVVVDVAFPLGVLAAFVAPTVLSLVQKRILPGIADAALIMLQKRMMSDQRDSEEKREGEETHAR